jgi:hypothetical protein
MNLEQEKIFNKLDGAKGGTRWTWETFSELVEIDIPTNAKKADHTQWVVTRNCKVGEYCGIAETQGKPWSLRVMNKIGVEKIENEKLIQYTIETAFQRQKSVHERWIERLANFEEDFKDMGFDTRQIEKLRDVIESVAEMFLLTIERSRILKPLELSEK